MRSNTPARRRATRSFNGFSSTARRLTAAGAAVALVCATSSAAGAATWTVAHPPFPALSSVPYAPLASVSAVSAGNAWAVGSDDGSMLAEHWGGGVWKQVSLPSGPCDVFESSCYLTSVSTDPTGGAIAVGNAVLNDNGWVPAALAYQWTGTAWKAIWPSSSTPYMSLAHVKAFSPTIAFAVGAGSNGTASSPVISYWDGTTWTQTTTGFTTTLGLTMNAIVGTSPNDLWIAGTTQSSGYHNRVVHSVVEHFDGANWSQVAIPDDSGVLDLAELSPTDAWALASDGAVLHWNGAGWALSATFNGGKALAAATSKNVWVGGIFVNSTLAVAHFDGSAWSTASAPAGIDSVTSAAATATGAIWFAGLQWPSNGTTIPAVLATTG